MHNLKFERTNDISYLKDFHCGVYEMDSYIHSSLQKRLDSSNDLRNYIVREEGIVVALCTLKDYKLQLKEGNYIDTIEIEYLAVRNDVQHTGIGSDIISWINNKVLSSRPEIRILSVDAFISDVTTYTAVPFYEKCDFKAMQKKHPMAEVIKMARLIKP